MGEFVGEFAHDLTQVSADDTRLCPSITTAEEEGEGGAPSSLESQGTASATQIALGKKGKEGEGGEGGEGDRGATTTGERLLGYWSVVSMSLKSRQYVCVCVCVYWFLAPELYIYIYVYEYI